MYEPHFGLTRRPFGETTDPAALVPLPSRAAALRRLRYGLEQAQGPVLVSGPPGVGKTLLARALARELGATAAHLTFPAMPAADLLAYLADELGAEPGPGPDAPPPVGHSLRRLRRRLSAAVLRGERPLLVLDEAHLIDDPAAFEAVRGLLNFATLGPPDLLLVIVGGPEVVFQVPPALADRLAARCALAPLTESESAAYLQGRLERAGARDRLFPPEAVAVLHRSADGLPRRLNRLADLALLVAYAEGLDRTDARTAAAAARELEPEVLAGCPLPAA